MNRKFLTLACFLTPVSLAVAGSESYTRQLTSTNAGACQNGTLAEAIQEYGNSHGFSSSVFVVCRQSAIEASWVLAAAQSCAGSRICNSQLAQQPLPFFGVKNFWDVHASPMTMRFNLLKYVKGTDCHVVPMKTKSEAVPEPADASAWACAMFETYYGVGMNSDNGSFSLRASKPFVLTTTGPTGPKSGGDSDEIVRLAIDPSSHTLEWVSEVIDP